MVVGARVEELSKQSRQAQCSLRRGIGCVKRGKKEEEEERRRKKKKHQRVAWGRHHHPLTCSSVVTMTDPPPLAWLAYITARREWLMAAAAAGPAVGPPKTESYRDDSTKPQLERRDIIFCPCTSS